MEKVLAVANDALRTIEADTAATVARVRVLLLNAWLRPLVVCLSLFLAFSGGSWALMHWLSASIQSRIETLATRNVQIERARETLVEIKDTTWGVTLREIDGERFVVLPDGTLDDPPWTVRGRPALKLSSERGSCMTELERQLMTALRTLSAQSRTQRRQHAEEQQRHSEQVEALRQRFEQQAAENATLRRQFERLDGQVTRLAQDYRTLAATLRGRWT